MWVYGVRCWPNGWVDAWVVWGSRWESGTVAQPCPRWCVGVGVPDYPEGWFCSVADCGVNTTASLTLVETPSTSWGGFLGCGCVLL